MFVKSVETEIGFAVTRGWGAGVLEGRRCTGDSFIALSMY